jgi:2-polyprenyl-3-methyl-5-hydroxy-6-metoxy-1,4-benzoquinol methylase
MQSPFFHYNACFDPVALIEKNKCKHPQISPSHLVNFLGLKINPDFMPECVRHLRGLIEPPPNPANWHADIAEFGAVFRAVDLASGSRFVMAELGCGWGCWMGIAGLAAKSRHFKVSLIGVEGDTKHLAWARENMVANGFSEEEYRLVHGIAAAQPGKALFPRNSPDNIHYGLEPIFNASRQTIEQAKTNNTHNILEMVPLRDVFSSEKRADLLHIDIQGGEVDLVKGSLDYLLNYVAYMVIGTHSRVIEGQLIDMLTKQGWILEIERPAIFDINGQKLITTVDGVQGWRNCRLLPPNAVSSVDIKPQETITPIIVKNIIMNKMQDIQWFHQIALPSGETTPGRDKTAEKCAHINFPNNLKEKSVIDIGCWDGFFSFESEHRGARRVVSSDFFVWKNVGTKDAGYDFAHKELGSKATKLISSIEDLDAQKIGTFDLVLMLGVLYHAPDPLGYLRKARSLCSEMLILETHVDMLAYPKAAIAYYEGNSFAKDPTNFWGPNTAAVVGMLKDSGFNRVLPQPVFWGSRQAFHAYV